jgi:tRNA A37 threonylcarbamoyladenosine modification protein TsaB
MYLLIDLSEKKIIDLILFDENNDHHKQFPGFNKDLLNTVGNFFKEIGITPKDLLGIAVIVGTGSFTGTRLAVTLANTFAYALKIKILTIKKEEKGDLLGIISKLKNKKAGEYVSATYSGEPNIGGKS